MDFTYRVLASSVYVIPCTLSSSRLLFMMQMHLGDGRIVVVDALLFGRFFRVMLHLAGVVFRILAAEQPEKAGVGEAQHQKQDDEGEQHPDDDVHLVDRQRELIVELLFRVDEIGVIVVEERFAALRSLCTAASSLACSCSS